MLHWATDATFYPDIKATTLIAWSTVSMTEMAVKWCETTVCVLLWRASKLSEYDSFTTRPSGNLSKSQVPHILYTCTTPDLVFTDFGISELLPTSRVFPHCTTDVLWLLYIHLIFIIIRTYWLITRPVTMLPICRINYSVVAYGDVFDFKGKWTQGISSDEIQLPLSRFCG
jgi:hypothetical protein